MLCLNKDVEKILLQDFRLFLIYRENNSPYDSEIDPLHNPDWVRDRQKQEIVNLESARKKLHQYTEYFTTITEDKYHGK